MTGIEKTVTNRSGPEFWYSVPYFLACAPVRKMLPIRQESGIAVRTSTGWHVPMLLVSRLATKDISVEVTTGKQPVWPIPGSMTSTMTGGRNVLICQVRFGMPLQVSRWGIKGTSLPVTIPIRSIWPIRGSTIRRQIPGGKWMTSKGEPVIMPLGLALIIMAM